AAQAQGRAAAVRCGGRVRGGAHVHSAIMIAHVRGRLASKSADRVVVETPGGVGNEVTLATELVVREDGWALYGFLDESERRFFQRITSVTGVGPKIGIALMS